MELDILKAIQTISNPFFDFLFQIITMFGEELFVLGFITTIYWTINKEAGEFIGFTCFISIFFNNIFKNIFDFKRPIGEEGIRSLRVETATGSSFPSGHSQGASTLYTSIALAFKKKYLIYFAAIIIPLVGFSRLYLGVHYPKDVIVGILFGLIITFLSSYYFYKIKNRFKFYLISLIIFIPIVFFINAPDLIKALGTYAGFVLGIYFEQKHVNFSVEGTLPKKIIRVIVGLIILFGLKVGLKAVFPSLLIFHFIRYAVLAIVGIGIYPLIFKKINL